jgi:hypothetical protein
VELKGPSAPPPATTLAQQISKHAGHAVTVSVTWRTAAAPPGTSPASETQQARSVVSTWLTAHPGLDVLGITTASAQCRPAASSDAPPCQ